MVRRQGEGSDADLITAADTLLAIAETPRVLDRWVDVETFVGALLLEIHRRGKIRDLANFVDIAVAYKDGLASLENDDESRERVSPDQPE